MADEVLLAHRESGVLTLTLNRPERRNAIDGPMWEALRAGFERARDDPETRVVVITGAGGAFCAGADLSAKREGHPLDRMRSINEIALLLHELPKPTVARVDGVAVGAGWNLALGCDLVVATPTSRFSQIFAKRGLSLDFGGSWLLPRLVGMQQAKRLALLAEMIDATEAERLGLVTWVTPRGGDRRVRRGPHHPARVRRARGGGAVEGPAARERRPHAARGPRERGAHPGRQLRHRGRARGVRRLHREARPALHRGVVDPVTGLFDLTGHVALVTGGNSGIGLGMARGLVRSGADVCLWGTNAERNAAAADELAGYGTRVRALRCDVGDEDAVEESFAATVRALRPRRLLLRQRRGDRLAARASSTPPSRTSAR